MLVNIIFSSTWSGVNPIPSPLFHCPLGLSHTEIPLIHVWGQQSKSSLGAASITWMSFWWPGLGGVLFWNFLFPGAFKSGLWLQITLGFLFFLEICVTKVIFRRKMVWCLVACPRVEQPCHSLSELRGSSYFQVPQPIGWGTSTNGNSVCLDPPVTDLVSHSQ